MSEFEQKDFLGKTVFLIEIINDKNSTWLETPKLESTRFSFPLTILEEPQFSQ